MEEKNGIKNQKRIKEKNRIKNQKRKGGEKKKEKRSYFGYLRENARKGDVHSFYDMRNRNVF